MRAMFMSTASKSGELLLDKFPGAVAAYSIRKLRADYSGPCLQVRRDSDNDELAIGFKNNVLDVNTLLSFVGSSSGYISKWNNQTNNNHDGIANTESLQYRIVDEGTLNYLNGKPALEGNGTYGGVNVQNASVFKYLHNDDNTMFFVIRNDNTNGSSTIMGTTSGNNVNRPGFHMRNRFIDITNSNGEVAEISYTPDLNQALYTLESKLSTTIQPSDRLKFFKNTIPYGSINTASTPINNSNSWVGRFNVGGRPGAEISTPFTGLVQEFIFYSHSVFLNKDAIETDINSFYNIY